MSIGTAFVLIAAIIAFTIIYSRRHDGRLGIVRDEDGNPVFPPSALDAEAERELAELRERVKVLERIVTDEAGPRSLAHEIESLREKE
jgi:hypothetical protein